MAILLSQAEKKRAAALAESTRGQLLLGKALFMAALLLSDPERPIEEQAPSDAADMDFIGRTLFPVGWNVAMMEHQRRVDATR